MRFGVSNHLSIRDYQEISLVAAALKDSGADLIKLSNVKEAMLPGLLVYGANASGKSNVLAAFRFFRASILDSHRHGSPTSNIPVHPFRLDKKFAEEPSRFDCDFVVNGVRYHYGFLCNKEMFLEEWLFAYPQGNRQTWFQRTNKEIKTGKYLKGEKGVVEKITRPNSLFLSASAQVNHNQLLPIYTYFQNSIKSIISHDVPSQLLNEQWSEAGIDDRTIRFLQTADTGINSFRIDEREMPQKSKAFREKLSKLVSEEFPDSPGFMDESDVTKEVLLGHGSGNEGDVYFDLASESRGTLRLLGIMKPIFEVLDNGGVALIDEIDASLHTLVARDIIRLFTSSEINVRGAQLIATTHDTSLLCSTELRRDQVWFTEKDKSGATHVYPLTDIRTRNTDNLEKGYLQGRFGAVPFFSSNRRLLFKNDR